MAADIIILAVSLVFLIVSSDKFVAAVVEFATQLKVSTMVIGLTVVAVGTSLPELAASVVAAFLNHPGIAVGNIVGSNICNIGLIIGLPALLTPVVCSSSVIRREGRLMIFVSVVFWLLSLFSVEFGLAIGLLFLLGFIGFIYWVFQQQGVNSVLEDIEHIKLVKTKHRRIRIVVQMILALAVVIVSSDYLVQSAVSLAAGLGVSEAVVALSLIAFGTSVPELSVSLAAVRRREGEIVVGNIIGSNISNILLVIGAAASIRPFTVDLTIARLDSTVMLIFAVLLLLFLSRPGGVSRTAAILLLAGYLLYIALRVTMGPAL